MRESTAIRQRLLERLVAIVRRPGMFVTSAGEADLVLRTLLGDLCFIDEREATSDV